MKEGWQNGIRGEKRAAEFLKSRGYRIIECNYRCRAGEIDIIAADREYLVFAEVKQRKSDAFGAAREYVTGAKQHRVKTAAGLWLAIHETDLQPRFDVIEIYEPDGIFGKVRIEHLEDAF